MKHEETQSPATTEEPSARKSRTPKITYVVKTGTGSMTPEQALAAEERLLAALAALVDEE